MMHNFMGWMSSEKMNEQWLDHWRNLAKMAEDNGAQLIIFVVPKVGASEAVEKADELFHEISKHLS